jgi:hypothetical protein
MTAPRTSMISRLILATAIALAAPSATRADVITDWNAKAEAIAIAKKIPPPPGARGMAIMHVAMFEAVNAIEQRYSPYRLKLKAVNSLSKEAAAAAAGHAVLIVMHPDQRNELDAVLNAMLATIPDGAAKTKAIELGRQSAKEILGLRAKDGVGAPDTYRPLTTPGSYVPTVIPAGVTFGAVMPWTMSSGSQFRPPPPPALTSMTWTNDVNEIRDFGGRSGGKRTAEQTDMARFWFMAGTQEWNPIVRQLAAHKQLDITDNARLFALVAMATSDSLIAVFDAKYHYNFWRPVTAIRNADLSDNNATPREASWLPLGETPMHPEYPCAHCIEASAASAVLQAIFGNDIPEVSMSSNTAPGLTRRWKQLSAYSDEMVMSRVYAGFHYRFSGKVAQEMGRKIAEQAVRTQLRRLRASAASTR